LKRTGSTLFTILFRYLKYRTGAKSITGRGIHSPLVYDLCRKVLVNDDGMRVPEQIIKARSAVEKDRSILTFRAFGAGSRTGSGTSRSIRSLATRSSVPGKYGALLYRLIRWYQPATVIELGTGIGVSTLYLAAASDQTVITVEGSPEKYAFAGTLLSQSGLKNVDLRTGTFHECLDGMESELKRRSVVFIDGDHRYLPTLELVNRLITMSIGHELLVVIDDIHWSDEMERAWKVLCRDPRIAVSVDIFQFGLLFIRDTISKQHFTITF
jgi:predicted O-methyltransferase YrrM